MSEYEAEGDGHGEDYDMSLVAHCGMGSLEPLPGDKISEMLLAPMGVFMRRPVTVSEIYSLPRVAKMIRDWRSA